jgi:hypothetical protein
MSLAQLTSVQLGQLVELIKQKEHHQAELARIDAELQVLETGAPLPKKRGRKPGRSTSIAGESRQAWQTVEGRLTKNFGSGGNRGHDG